MASQVAKAMSGFLSGVSAFDNAPISGIAMTYIESLSVGSILEDTYRKDFFEGVEIVDLVSPYASYVQYVPFGLCLINESVPASALDQVERVHDVFSKVINLLELYAMGVGLYQCLKHRHVVMGCYYAGAMGGSFFMFLCRNEYVDEERLKTTKTVVMVLKFFSDCYLKKTLAERMKLTALTVSIHVVIPLGIGILAEKGKSSPTLSTVGKYLFTSRKDRKTDHDE